jgi:hypothetical protein
MELLERLEYHIRRLDESNSDIALIIPSPSHYKVKETIVYKNLSSNELQQFIRQEWQAEGARGLYFKNTWYFWNGLGALHDTVARKLGMTKVIDIIAASVEIDRGGKRLSNDFFHRTAELETEMNLKEFTSYLTQLMRTLKSLESIYHIDLEDIFYDLYRAYKRKKWPEPSYEEIAYSKLNKQQRHDHRVWKNKQYSSWIPDIKLEDLDRLL